MAVATRAEQLSAGADACGAAPRAAREGEGAAERGAAARVAAGQGTPLTACYEFFPTSERRSASW